MKIKFHFTDFVTSRLTHKFNICPQTVFWYFIFSMTNKKIGFMSISTRFENLFRYQDLLFHFQTNHPKRSSFLKVIKGSVLEGTPLYYMLLLLDHLRTQLKFQLSFLSHSKFLKLSSFNQVISPSIFFSRHHWPCLSVVELKVKNLSCR